MYHWDQYTELDRHSDPDQCADCDQYTDLDQHTDPDQCAECDQYTDSECNVCSTHRLLIFINAYILIHEPIDQYTDLEQWTDPDQSIDHDQNADFGQSIHPVQCIGPT
jgi:hypothetical protein